MKGLRVDTSGVSRTTAAMWLVVACVAACAEGAPDYGSFGGSDDGGDAGDSSTSAADGSGSRWDARTGTSGSGSGLGGSGSGTESSSGSGTSSGSGGSSGSGTSSGSSGSSGSACALLSCIGCCDGNSCVDTPTDTQCGLLGAPCQNCAASGEVCGRGTCRAPRDAGASSSGSGSGSSSGSGTCDANSCPNGCCTTRNQCATGDTDTACATGNGGDPCEDCRSESLSCSCSSRNGCSCM